MPIDLFIICYCFVNRDNFEKGIEGGAAFSACWNGETIVDLWGGYKNVKTKEPWTEDTMTMAMSTTNGK